MGGSRRGKSKQEFGPRVVRRLSALTLNLMNTGSPNERQQTMISVLILTKNEEQDLPGCLKSVGWSDDIHVYDSGSTDATTAIANRAGAVVDIRPSSQQPEVFG